MPRFRIHDAFGGIETVDFTGEELAEKRGVLEALAADDDINDIRLGDVGLADLAATEFVRAVHVAYSPTRWTGLENVVGLWNSPRGPEMSEAVAWLGVESTASLANALRRGSPLPGDEAAELISGFRRAREAERTPEVSLQSVFLAGHPASLFGVLVGGSVAARSKRRERMQWAVVQTMFHGHLDALRFLWHVRSTEGALIWFENKAVGASMPEDFRGLPHELEERAQLLTPFVVAARAGHAPIARFLWSLRHEGKIVFDPAACESDAFVGAAASGSTDTLIFLHSLITEHNIPIDPCAHECAALKGAIQNGHVDALRAMWPMTDWAAAAAGAELRFDDLFLDAAEKGHVEVMHFLWSTAGPAFADPAKTSNLAFRTAASHGRVEVLRFLTSLADTDDRPAAVENEGLLSASKAGHVEAVRLLLQMGVGDDVRRSAFRQAVIHGHSDTARVVWAALSERSADLSVVFSGETDSNLFEEVAESGHVQSLEFLWELHVTFGVDVDPTGVNFARSRHLEERPNVALLAAVSRKHLPVVEFLARLHRDGAVPIHEDDIAHAILSADASVRPAVIAALVDVVDASEEVAELRSSMSSGSAVPMLARLRELTSSIATRESVATAPGIEAFVAGRVHTASDAERDLVWALIDDVMKSSHALQALGANSSVLLALARELNSATEATRVRALRILQRLEETPENRAVLSQQLWSKSSHLAVLGTAIRQGILGDSVPVRRSALILASRLKMRVDPSDKATALRLLSTLHPVLQHGSGSERHAAVQLITQDPALHARKSMFAVPGLFVSLVSASTLSKISNVLKLMAAEKPVASPTVLAEIIAALQPRLEPDASDDDQVLALEFLAELQFPPDAGELVRNERFSTAVIRAADCTKVSASRSRCAIWILGKLAIDPVHRQLLVGIPAFLPSIFSSATQTGDSDARHRARQVISLVLFGHTLVRKWDYDDGQFDDEDDEVDDEEYGASGTLWMERVRAFEKALGSMEGVECIPLPEAAVELIALACLPTLANMPRLRLSQHWCLSILFQLSRRPSNCRALCRVPGLLEVLVRLNGETHRLRSRELILQMSKSVECRACLVDAPGFLPLLAEILRSPDREVRGFAVDVLRNLVCAPDLRADIAREREVVDGLLRGLETPTIRDAAAATLQALGQANPYIRDTLRELGTVGALLGTIPGGRAKIPESIAGALWVLVDGHVPSIELVKAHPRATALQATWRSMRGPDGAASRVLGSPGGWDSAS